MTQDALPERPGLNLKPALLRGREFFEAGPTHLVCTDAENRQKWCVAWTEIAGIAFVEHTMRGMRLSRLDLLPRGAAPLRRIACTVPRVDADENPEYAGFRATMAAIAGQLAETAPDLPVTIGEYGRSRLLMFGIGVISTVGAVTIAALAAAGGRGDALIGEALVPVVLMFLFGVAVAWGTAPWRRLPRVPVAIFAKALKATPAVTRPED